MNRRYEERISRAAFRESDYVFLESTPLATFLALLADAVDLDDGDNDDDVAASLSAIDAFLAELPPNEMRALSYQLRLVGICCEARASDLEQKGDFFCCTERFGGCPQCGKQDGPLNAGRDHWGYCDTHKCCWWLGHNLLSSWEDETKEEQEEKLRHIEGYTKVEPLGLGSWPKDPIMRAYERVERRIADAKREARAKVAQEPNTRQRARVTRHPRTRSKP